MAAIVFFAIILGRPALSLRSVALAAALTLWLHPESLLSAGFQMSFAAATALIVVYAAWQMRRAPQGRPSGLRRIWSSFAALSVTSIVAGAATAGFSMFHFHHIARYGLAGNLLAMPLFSAIVMPAGVIALLAMPFGLEAAPLYVMGWGLDKILMITAMIESWPKAWITVSGAPDWAPAVFGLGFVILCVASRWRRIIGLAIIAAIIPAWLSYQQPDIRVSDNGHLAFWGEGISGAQQQGVLYVDNTRADKYGRSRFVERAGQAEWDMEDISREHFECDALACRITLKGILVSRVTDIEALQDECFASDLVIFAERAAGPVMRRKCQAKLIDQRSLSETGALDITLIQKGEGTEISVKAANSPERKSRPWAKTERY